MEDLIMIACALLAWLALGFGVSRLMYRPDDELLDEEADRLARQYDHDIAHGLNLLDDYERTDRTARSTNLERL